MSSIVYTSLTTLLRYYFYNRMYNGIGLQTSRGSGTSGHVQSNISVNHKKLQNRQQFLQELEAKRNANVAPPRKANQEIIQHERKREILIKSMELREKLQAEGLAPEVIEEKVKKGEEILRKKFEAGEIKTHNKDTHVLNQAKQKEYIRLSHAFGLQVNAKQGSAFDFDHNREQKTKKMAQRAEKRGLNCPHANCGKKYETEQHLARHLKYKHPKIEEKEK